MGIDRHVFTRGASPAPYELVKALMCREFHIPPDELGEHEAVSLFRTFGVLNYYDERVEVKREQERQRKGKRG